MAKRSTPQYGTKRHADFYDFQTAPIPRHRFAELVKADLGGSGDPGLAEHVTRLWVKRREQLSSRNLMDVRMLRYLDPERMEDHWQNWLTGAPLAKLQTSGLSIELQQYPLAVVEALNGLLAGFKPMAYQFDVLPEDSMSDASIAQAEAHEKWLYREQDDQDYPTVYLDLITYFNAIGRAWRMVTMNERTRRIRTVPLWPGHVAAFWQQDGRTIEQVIVARNLSIGEAVAEWPDRQAEIERAVFAGFTNTSRGSERRNVDILSSDDQVTVLNCWYRLGNDGETIGVANILIGADNNKTSGGRLLLDADDDISYPDIPLRCTPVMKVPDRTPDESSGPLQAIAGSVTSYAEVLASYHDLVRAMTYPKFVAQGFTFRNAPRIDRTIGGVIPLPRGDQRLVRLEETLNSVPPEQLLAHEEKLIVLLAGLNPHFLGVAPPSETSGEAISASIHASVMRLEPRRSNIQRDEIWTYRMWSGLTYEHGEYEFEGRTVKASAVLLPWPTLSLQWRDIRPREETRAKQMALAAVGEGIISKDAARDEWSVLSKSDEVRKIIRERQNPITNPENAASTANAIILMARAKAMSRPQPEGALAAGGGNNGDPAAVAGEMAVTEGARGAPPAGTADNEAGGAMPPTTAASTGAPPRRM